MDEILDVVNQDDEVIRRDSRKKIYKQGLPEKQYIRYVNILIFNKENKLLLPMRSSNKSIFPNCYDFSCGEHLKSGESYEDAAKRGLDEELGLNGFNLELLGKLSPKDNVSGFMKIYRLILDQDDIKENNEFESLNWYKVEDIISMIKNKPSKFKDDLLTVLNWYISNFS